MKWSRYFGIEVAWNLLWGIPGEVDEDYDRQDALFNIVHHLEPPQSMPEIRVQRFSPMQRRPGDFGLDSIVPAQTFVSIFPDFDRLHERLTYFFDAPNHVGIALERARCSFEVVQRWRKCFRDGSSLSYARLPGGKLIVEDRRDPSTLATEIFLYPASLIYEFCSIAIMSPSKLARLLARIDARYADPEILSGLLRGFCERRIMTEEKGLFLALGLPVSRDLLTLTEEEYIAKLEECYSGYANRSCMEANELRGRESTPCVDLRM